MGMLYSTILLRNCSQILISVLLLVKSIEVSISACTGEPKHTFCACLFITRMRDDVHTWIVSKWN